MNKSSIVKQENPIPEAKVLAGVEKQSFSLSFGGGELWIEHLDGIGMHTDLAIEKLEHDYQQFKRPSLPSLIAINLDETVFHDALMSMIAKKLLNGSKRFTRVVFVGVDQSAKRKLKHALSNAQFALNFINDFEQAKQWLIGEKYD